MLSLVRITVAPPAGAVPEIVTVPVEDAPPTTDVGLSATEIRPGAVTARAADSDMLFTDAVIVAVRLVTTGVVETANIPVI